MVMYVLAVAYSVLIETDNGLFITIKKDAIVILDSPGNPNSCLVPGNKVDFIRWCCKTLK